MPKFVHRFISLKMQMVSCANVKSAELSNSNWYILQGRTLIWTSYSWDKYNASANFYGVLYFMVRKLPLKNETKGL